MTDLIDLLNQIVPEENFRRGSWARHILRPYFGELVDAPEKFAVLHARMRAENWYWEDSDGTERFYRDGELIGERQVTQYEN